jgi:pimeloyl-ACP methyl ester carboxylesterase
MAKNTLTIILALISLCVLGQRFEYTFTTPGDTTKNYYVTVSPPEKIKGAIILLPGFGELPKQTLAEWDFPQYAAEAGYLTIIPALGDWSFFYIDDYSHERLKHFIDEVFRKFNLNENSFVIGGASFGGTMALQYAQKAFKDKSTLKKPVAVFALDPPLDIERLYRCMTTTNRPATNPISVQEDNYITKRIEQEFKITPEVNPQYFWAVSPYAQSDIEHRNLKTLLSIPIRIYNEPDINWYIENRGIDFYCINSLDSSAMINWLRYWGNKGAELVLTSGKGYRISEGERHPHSWSIADGKELTDWVIRSTKR